MNKLKLQGNLNVQGDLRFSNNTGIPTLPRFGVDAAYSVRRLFNEYNGPLMRVRRSSDNVELDIGYTKFNLLDTVSILNFCGINTGTVVAWYDQSGNGYTAGVNNVAYGVSYPVICSGGGVSRLQPGGIGAGDIPGIDFDSSSGLITSTALPDFNYDSVFVVESHLDTGLLDSKNQRIYSKRNSDILLSVLQPGAGFVQNTYTYKRGNASLSVTTVPSQTFLLTKNIIDVTNVTTFSVEIRGNNVLQPYSQSSSGAPQNNAGFALGIGTNVNNVPPAGGNYFSGRISELVIYNTDMQVYRQAIISNMNYYYNTF